MAGAEAQILRTLESFGLQWDGAVVRQSERTALYAAALDQLQATREVFRCQCSRRDISQSIASGSCCVSQCEQRQASIGSGNVALRWRPKHSAPVSFDDIWQGRQNIENPPDVVLRRRDGLHAYHLAVVVDDAAQGVNQVVRGADLLECTGWHILIQRSLGLGVPVYGHLPLLTEANGEKLSKSRRSVTLNAATAGPMLHQSLQRLGQRPPTVLAGAPVAEIWHWALRCWRPEALRGTRAVAARA